MKHQPALGDLTFEVGFTLAALRYKLQGESKVQEQPVIPGQTAAAVAG